MNQPQFIASIPFQEEDHLQDWFSRCMRWQEEFQKTGYPVRMEFFIQRAGAPGCFPDNPPLEDLESLFDLATALKHPFGSLYLPVQFPAQDEKIGEEISALNGWADLASYAEFMIVRLFVQPTERLESASIQKSLISVVDYMNEMDLHVSVTANNDQEILLQSILERVPFREKVRHGLHRRIQASDLATLESLPPRIHSVSIPMNDSWCIPEIINGYESICTKMEDRLHTVIFEI